MTTPSRRGRPSHADLLTPAEWRVVHAVKHGMTSRQIAAQRGISIDAVKFHVANALKARADQSKGVAALASSAEGQRS